MLAGKNLPRQRALRIERLIVRNGQNAAPRFAVVSKEPRFVGLRGLGE
jgi:hypothetical protein